MGKFKTASRGIFFFCSMLTSALILSSCYNTPGAIQNQANGTSAFSNNGGSNISVPAGARAIKIIMRQANPTGSFDIPSGSGTPAVPGSGLQAIRVFNADGSLLAQGGPGSNNWPTWLNSFEIGVSGSSNASAPNPHCARFSQTGEDTGTQCDFNRNANPLDSDGVNCGAPPSYFRVSEYDCTRNSDTLTGNGGASDGVYMRAVINRNPAQIGPSENLNMVIEYASSALNPPPANPTVCMSNGQFDPTAPGCSDMTWRVFAKHNVSEVVSPTLMLVPPTFGNVNAQTNTGGSIAGTKQILIPLRDQGISVIQLSRIKALANGGATSDFGKVCNGVNNPANSAYCVGMVFYSITLYRM